MPTYSYRCEDCAQDFERSEPISEHETARPRCPKCGGHKVSWIPRTMNVITKKKS